MPSDLHSKILHLASGLPKGDDTRKKLLAALKVARGLPWFLEEDSHGGWYVSGPAWWKSQPNGSPVGGPVERHQKDAIKAAEAMGVVLDPRLRADDSTMD